jgi:cob(I)alamin adenosyltransferase
MTARVRKVYTRRGDDGTTSLFGGGRVPKDHPRIEACGCLDELNSLVGLCRTALLVEKKLPIRDRKELEARLLEAQNRLFDLGMAFSTPEGRGCNGMPRSGVESVTALELSMDAMQKFLKPLDSFVLPGGSLPDAWLHLCRTVCRRAERRVSALMRLGSAPPEAVIYLNRLSDWFFVAARLVALRVGAPERYHARSGKVNRIDCKPAARRRGS